jgi:hypothetical protein
MKNKNKNQKIIKSKSLTIETLNEITYRKSIGYFVLLLLAKNFILCQKGVSSKSKSIQ